MSSRTVRPLHSPLDHRLGVDHVKEWAPADPTGLWMVEVVLSSGETLRACAKTAERARKRLHLKLLGEQQSAA